MKRLICWSFVFCVLFYACGTKASNEAMLAMPTAQEEYAAEAEEFELLEDDDLTAEQYDEDNVEGSTVTVTASQLASTSYSWRSETPKKNKATVNSLNTTEETSLSKKKIIKDGDIIIQTNDIEVAKKEFDILIKSLNGYYERENLKKSDYRIEYDLKIRVPANYFEKLVSSIEQGKNEVKSKNIHARDVTEEYTDLTIRLSSKREYLKQYTVLLAKANSIKEILEIKEIIRNLHEEIERTEGRLRYLSDQVTFSTLNVELYQKIDYVYKPQRKDSFIERVKSGLNTGWRIVVEVVLFLINIWSVILILAIIAFFVRKKIKKRKQRKNS